MMGAKGGSQNQAIQALIQLAASPDEFQLRLDALEERERRANEAEEKAKAARAEEDDAHDLAVAAETTAKAALATTESAAAALAQRENEHANAVKELLAEKEAVAATRRSLEHERVQVENAWAESAALRASLTEKIAAADAREAAYAKKLAQLKAAIA